MSSRSLGILLVLVLVLVLGLSAPAQEKGKGAADEPLKPNSPWAADGVVAESLKESEKEVKLSVGKNATVILDLAVKAFPVRLDRADRRGPPPVSAFKQGRRAILLGRESERTRRTQSEVVTEWRISPWHALVVGEGFDPQAVPPAAKQKFGEKATRWWKSTVTRFEAPDNLWVKCEDARERLVTISRDDRLLVTTAYESDVFAPGGQLRKALVKGQPVRFKGMVQTILYTDAKGRLTEDTRKPGVKAEVHLAPAKIALLDPQYPYELVETAESF